MLYVLSLPDNGNVVEIIMWYENGNLQSNKKYENGNLQHKLHGVCKTWYENGTKRSEIF